MASRNDVTNDLLISKTLSEEGAANWDKIFPENFGTVSDGFGSEWVKCSKRCWLEVVRLGKVQCNKPGCKNK